MFPVMLFNLWLKIFKQRIIKKFSDTDFKPITNFLDRNNARIFAFLVQHTVNRRGGNATLVSKGVNCDVLFQASRMDTACNCHLSVH